MFYLDLFLCMRKFLLFLISFLKVGMDVGVVVGVGVVVCVVVGLGVGLGVGVLKGSLVIDSMESRTTITEEQCVTTFLSSSSCPFLLPLPREKDVPEECVPFISVLQRKMSFSSVGFA